MIDILNWISANPDAAGPLGLFLIAVLWIVCGAFGRRELK